MNMMMMMMMKSWKQLSAGLLASFPCKLNKFREREFKWELSVNKLSDVKCSDVE
jgi:hypothetical protein